ncbi:MAG: 3-methyl-2-oxobutanoate hydroxymethyltransferase [Micavibrio sp.]|nr:3-methyl-2-oxobutanoate hydroxymethyltransferase [Micavibrio sp.]|tara:strand:- start:6934 stop:7773 length:840 start_codon:yes stop_codon:yes gene_type:complete
MTQTQPRISVDNIRSHKNKDEPLVCLTAYTAPMASILDQHCDLLLVGDSMGMALYGMDNTLDVTLDMIIAHTKAVMRGSQNAFVLADMPYGTYEDDPQIALQNAQRLINETNCSAVKLEGDQSLAPTVELLTRHNIPVIAHIGLRPQMVIEEGGYKIKGKTEEQARALLEDAKTLEKAGAFCILIEGTIEPVSAMISASLNVPTIGIGASANCDGQILVIDDMLGMLSGTPPKFAKQYGHIQNDIDKMVAQYSKEVRTRIFPSEDYLYTVKNNPLRKAS